MNSNIVFAAACLATIGYPVPARGSSTRSFFLGGEGGLRVQTFIQCPANNELVPPLGGRESNPDNVVQRASDGVGSVRSLRIQAGCSRSHSRRLWSASRCSCAACLNVSQVLTVKVAFAGGVDGIFGLVRFDKIWIEQCRATRAIKRRFGATSALDYLIGEKLQAFADAATVDPDFAAELPRFLSAVYRVFNQYEIAGYVATRKPRAP